MIYKIEKVYFINPIEGVEYVSFHYREAGTTDWFLIASSVPVYPQSTNSNIGLLASPLTLTVGVEITSGITYEFAVTNNDAIVSQFSQQINIPTPNTGTTNPPVIGPGVGVIEGPGVVKLMTTQINLNQPTNLNASGNANPLVDKETTSQTIAANDYIFGINEDKVGLNVQFNQPYTLLTATEDSILYAENFSFRMDVKPSASTFDIFFVGNDANYVRFYGNFVNLILEIKRTTDIGGEETDQLVLEGLNPAQWNSVFMLKRTGQFFIGIKNDDIEDVNSKAMKVYQNGSNQINLFGRDAAKNNMLVKNLYVSTSDNEFVDLLTPQYHDVKINEIAQEFVYNPIGSLGLNATESGDIEIENKIGEVNINIAINMDNIFLNDETKVLFEEQFVQNSTPTLLFNDKGYSLGLPGESYAAVEFQNKPIVITSKNFYGYGEYYVKVTRDENAQNFVMRLEAEADYLEGTPSYFNFRNSNPGVSKQFIELKRTPEEIWLSVQVLDGSVHQISREIVAQTDEKLGLIWDKTTGFDIQIDGNSIMTLSNPIPKFNSKWKLKHDVGTNTDFELSYVTLTDIQYIRTNPSTTINLKTEDAYEIKF